VSYLYEKEKFRAKEKKIKQELIELEKAKEEE
jgi:hypothetical protein